tara:strand:+ start:1893 stop:2024 length:132 start_codon:yes stop_codon:yes gene_type:complete
LREHLGFELTWKEYEERGHLVSEPEGVDDLAAFVKERMAAGPD